MNVCLRESVYGFKWACIPVVNLDIPESGLGEIRAVGVNVIAITLALL